YMPPEQARAEHDRVDRRSDVFGLGALLCVVLTGQAPYAGTREEVRAQAQRGDVTAAFSRLDSGGADAELIALAKRCLAPERDGRPAHAGAVADAVAAHRAAVQERARVAEQERAASQARAEEAQATAAAERRARRLTLGLAIAGLLLVLAVGTAAWV